MGSAAWPGGAAGEVEVPSSDPRGAGRHRRLWGRLSQDLPRELGAGVASVPDHRAHVTGLYVGFVKRGASVKTLQGLGEKGPLEGEL